MCTINGSASGGWCLLFVSFLSLHLPWCRPLLSGMFVSLHLRHSVQPLLPGVLATIQAWGDFLIGLITFSFLPLWQWLGGGWDLLKVVVDILGSGCPHFMLQGGYTRQPLVIIAVFPANHASFYTVVMGWKMKVDYSMTFCGINPHPPTPLKPPLPPLQNWWWYRLQQQRWFL